MAITDAIQTLQPGQFLSFITTQFAGFWFWLKIIGSAFLLIGGGLWLLMWYRRYNIRVIFDRGGNNWVTDRARLMRDNEGRQTLILLKNRIKTKGYWLGKQYTAPFPESKYRQQIGGTDFYMFRRDDNFQLHPIEYDVTGAGHAFMRQIPQERTAWLFNESKQVEQTYRKASWVEKYGTIVMVWGALVVVMVIWIFAVQELGKGLTDLSHTFAQVAASCTALR